MTEDRKPGPEGDKCAHPLMCADDWKDPAGAKVLGEYHKGDLPTEEELVEGDLDAFETYWQEKQGKTFLGEYHKEGAPYLERPSEWEGHLTHSEAMKREAMGPAGPMERKGTADLTRKGEAQPTAPVPLEKETGASPPAGPPSPPKTEEKKGEEPSGEKRMQLPISEVLNLNTIEVFTYWFIRLAFGKQLYVPIRREGLADMDIRIENKDVSINTNQLYFVVPELVVWHITYSHKGRPVLEIGRGVPNGMRVHRFNALRLGIEMWLNGRKVTKLPASKGPGPASSTAKELDDKGDIT